MSQRYVICSPTLVVLLHADATRTATLPCDSVIEAPESLNELRGLIKVRFNGENLLMFAEDIQERGMLVSSASDGN